ncbi:hypothetical protein SAMN04487968_10528 [Nocardioides terrae]|uniref:Transcriptional regulator, AbiEi antitoxin, Type IV TA system n=1 Tax=Nocardioides terrae TaxID=574651 RepID=A0A1I1HUV3_9ACTN|nr:hypothetical protein SAMN04487968_10528 [Nocardioides terrae]
MGAYVPADLDEALAVEQRIVSAAWPSLGVGVVTGWAALRWLGAKYLDEDTVHLVVPRTSYRAQPGISYSAERLADAETVVLDGLAVTGPLRSVTFAARFAADLAAAVKVLDRAAAADLVSLDEVRRSTTATLAGAVGVGQLREALGLAVENSWSPTETEMRLLWRGLGLVEVRCNTPIFDLAGRHLGTPDLFAPAVGMIGEYDGSEHLDGARRASDIRREGAFRRAGLEYVEMVAADRRDPRDFLARTTDALSRVDRSRWRWTLEAPPWWRRTETVAQRRALTSRDRQRLLGWQR